MLKEMTVVAKTVEAALQNAAETLGKDAESLEYEVLEQPKKGFLGIGNTDAKILVKYEENAESRAKEFILMFLHNLGFTDITITCTVLESGEVLFSISGEGLGLVIGRHGEILDSLQYLTNLAANKQEKEFVKILVDIENYREKRVEALKALAHKVAARVLKSNRSISLEPMNAYERRIIHSEVQDIEGVITFSVGSGSDRKIVMAPENSKKKPDEAPKRPSGGKAKGQRRSDGYDKRPKSAPASSQEAPKDEAKADEKPQAKPERVYDPDAYRKNATVVAGAAPKVYEYNPVRQPQQIKKAKSIEELGLADVEDTEEVLIKK